ncbi:MAG: hypothetical protein KDA69_21600 [Planctomycetaceae bacterium]|nr:hypothetical protein [Planctomycetaceae bacterium]
METHLVCVTKMTAAVTAAHVDMTESLQYPRITHQVDGRNSCLESV